MRHLCKGNVAVVKGAVLAPPPNSPTPAPFASAPAVEKAQPSDYRASWGRADNTKSPGAPAPARLLRWWGGRKSSTSCVGAGNGR